jgi:hypothetical protein
MLSSLLGVVIVLAVLGIIAWLVNRAPMIDASFKQFITFSLLVIGVVVVVVFLLSLVGGAGINPRLTI